MKLKRTRQLECRDAGKRVNAYIDNELSVEDSRELLRHLAACHDCTQLVEESRRTKHRVRAAVNAAGVPAQLLVSLREQFGGTVREKKLAKREQFGQYPGYVSGH